MTEREPEKRIEIGIVGRAHGLRGEVKVRLHWAEGETLRAGARFCGVKDGVEGALVVASERSAGKLRIVQFVGVTDRTSAEGLSGTRLSVPRAQMPKLAAGEYYLCDLVGARVETSEGRIGTVVAVEMYPGADALAIDLEDGTRALQVLGAPGVESVDAEAGVVRLSSTDGLI